MFSSTAQMPVTTVFFWCEYTNPRCIYQESDQFAILVDTTRSKIWSFLMGILMKVWREFWHFLTYALVTFKTIAGGSKPLPLCGLCSLGFSAQWNSTKHRSLHNLFFHLLAYLPEAELCCASTVHTSASWLHFYPQNIYLQEWEHCLWDEIVARKWEVMEVFSVSQQKKNIYELLLWTLIWTQTSDSLLSKERSCLYEERMFHLHLHLEIVWVGGLENALLWHKPSTKPSTALYEFHKITDPTKWIPTVPLTGAEVIQASDVRWCLWFLFCLKISEWDRRADKMAWRLTFYLLYREIYFSLCELIDKNFEDGILERWGHVFLHQSMHTFWWILFHLLLPSYMTSSSAALEQTAVWVSSSAFHPFPGCTPSLPRVSTRAHTLSMFTAKEIELHCWISASPWTFSEGKWQMFRWIQCLFSESLSILVSFQLPFSLGDRELRLWVLDADSANERKQRAEVISTKTRFSPKHH